MRTEIIKLTIREADKAFPTTSEESGEVNAALVDQNLIRKVCQEVVNNCGYADIDKIENIAYYDCFNEKMQKDVHGDEYIKCADYNVSFVDGTTEQWTFVCLM